MSTKTKRYLTRTWPRGAWIARRIGHIYCAPACGNGCLYVAYQKAVEDAAALAADLGPGWKPRVHENLGWHWEVISPCRRVRIGKGYLAQDKQFHISMGRPGDCGIIWNVRSTSARAGIRRVQAAAQAHAAEETAMFSKPVKFSQ